jgi:hypothetical protein
VLDVDGAHTSGALHRRCQSPITGKFYGPARLSSQHAILLNLERQAKRLSASGN